MLSGLSRLLGQTKSALKAPIIIAIGYATCIEMLTMATLIINQLLFLLLSSSILSTATSSLASTKVLELGWSRVKQQAIRLDMIIGRSAVLAGRYLSSTLVSQRTFLPQQTSLLPHQTQQRPHILPFFVDYQYRLHGGNLHIPHITPHLALPSPPMTVLAALADPLLRAPP